MVLTRVDLPRPVWPCWRKQSQHDQEEGYMSMFSCQLLGRSTSHPHRVPFFSLPGDRPELTTTIRLN